MIARAARLQEFFRRLAAADAADSAAAALQLISDILREVEDELSGIPFDPSLPLSDGRMYAPQADARRDVPGRPDLARYRSRAHNTYVSDRGAIRIDSADTGACVLDKLGSDGSRIDL